VVAAAKALSLAFSSVSFDLASAPPIERKAEAPKKKEKTAAAAEPAEPTTAAIPKKENAPEDKPKEKKEKKKDAAADNGGKKKEKASAPAASKPVAEDAGEPVPSMIDMRVGHIVDGELVPNLSFEHYSSTIMTVKKHPEADSLYIEVSQYPPEVSVRLNTFPISK
jgi:aminoacyl tRNA synthase complex-interacting multifunctional protein 1